MRGWEAVEKKMTSFIEAKGKKSAELEKTVQNSKRQSADPKTAPTMNEHRKRAEHGDGSERNGGKSTQEKSMLSTYSIQSTKCRSGVEH